MLRNKSLCSLKIVYTLLLSSALPISLNRLQLRYCFSSNAFIFFLYFFSEMYRHINREGVSGACWTRKGYVQLFGL